MQKKHTTRYILFIVGVMSLIFGKCLDCADVDMYHTIATGKEILQNGIPDINVWAIDSDLPFMAQMWSYSVALAWLDQFSYIVFPLFLFLQVCVLIGIIYALCRMKSCDKMPSFLIAVTSCFLTGMYTFTIRPETFTMCLIMLQCLCIEKYLSSGKWHWLTAFVPIMVLEANVHSSMWFLHVLVSIAYVCYVFRLKFVQYMILAKQAVYIVISTVIMIPAACISPYRYKVLTYTFQALLAGTFKILPFVEMQRSPVLSMTTVFVLLFISAVVWVIIKHYSLRSVSLNFAIGFSLMAILAYRNVFFCMIPFVYLSVDLLHDLDLQKIYDYFAAKSVKVGIYAISGFCALITLLQIPNYVKYDLKYDVGFSKISDVVLQTGNKTDKIFAPVSVTSYFEYLGYTNIYMDNRPELYNEVICGKPVLQNYAKFVMRGEDGIDDWINDYAFDYIITSPQTVYLYGYAPSLSNYIKVDTVDIGNTSFDVYKRVEGK